MTRSMRIAFLHPDLGLGGAERLVLDAARALGEAGHRVTLFTAHLDPHRCFPAAIDGTLDVRVAGSFLPLHVGGRLRAPAAIVRMAFLALASARIGERFEVVFCDLVSHVLALVKRAHRAKVVFYGHFPDQLLAPRAGGAYAAYRKPIDALEARGLAAADRVLVNSRYTADAFRRTFPASAAAPLEILYPAVDVVSSPAPPPADERVVLVLQRFEERKNGALALDAFAALRARADLPSLERCRLVFAGGFDPRLAENRETEARLRARAEALGIADRVTFVRSPSDAERERLLARAACLLHPPAEEHLGIAPLEAMAAARPVVAVRGGGVVETVRDGETGILCDPSADALAAALERVLGDPGTAARMGRAGRAHVLERFSRTAFRERLDGVVRSLAGGSA